MGVSPVYVHGARTGEVPETVATADPEIKILPARRVGKVRRKMFRRLPFGAADGIYPFGRDTNDSATQFDALQKRLCRKLPDIDPAVLSDFRKFVGEWCAENLSPIQAGGVLSFEEWLESTTYSGKRKDELRSVYSELAGQLPDKETSSRVNAFIKTESYPVGPTFKAARWICSRCDAAKVSMGPAFKTIEREVYSNHHFVKHVPVKDRPALISSLTSAGLRYIITDYTAFEASFHPDLMHACELQMYAYMLQNYPDLANYVVRTIGGVNKIRTRLGTRVTILGRRMSGDMCTSLGNGFTNLMLMKFFCARIGSSFDGFVEGDDGVFAINGPLPTKEMFATLGFDIKLAEISSPSLGGFCGVFSAGSSLVRDPVRFLQDFGWTSTCVDGGEHTMMALLRAKALSALYEAPACPIVSAIAARALELTTGVEPRFQLDGYHVAPPKVVPLPQPIDADTRDLFQVLFGVDAPAQIEIERLVASATDLSFVAKYLGYDPRTGSGVHPNHELVRSWFVGP